MTSSNQSKAHALPAARRRHHHVRIILRNLLAVPSPCRGISEDASCDMKTVRRCGGIGVSFCSGNQLPKCTASRTISEQHTRHLGQYEPVAYLAVWARLGESVRTKSEHQGAELKRAISVSSQREWLQNNSFVWMTVCESLNFSERQRQIP